jgi:DNA-binding transcriptional ArsR family regulator
MIAIDAYVIDTLLPDLVGHDRQPSAFLVYVSLWRHTHGAGNEQVELSLGELSEKTGLSRRGVQDALTRLVNRKLVTIERESVTSSSIYRVNRPWLRPERKKS